MTPIKEMTVPQLTEALRVARRLQWISDIHIDYLHELELEASHRKLNL